jgi:transcriptional regulatory protein RtcR
VDEEMARLRDGWQMPEDSGAAMAPALWRQVLPDTQLDLFDQAQMEAVLAACRDASSLSEAGRSLFAVSRQARSTANDADRLRKYLARFGLDWAGVRAVLSP